MGNNSTVGDWMGTFLTWLDSSDDALFHGSGGVGRGTYLHVELVSLDGDGRKNFKRTW